MHGGTTMTEHPTEANLLRVAEAIDLANAPIGWALIAREARRELIELRSEVARLSKREGEWREAMPRCQFISNIGQCSEPATMGTTHHEPEFCDEHAKETNRRRSCDWAHLIREGT